MELQQTVTIMSKRAEEAALEAYNDMFHNPEKMSVRSTVSEEEAAQFDYKEPFKAFFLDVYQQGYEQAEKDLTFTAQFSSGPDGFFYGKGYQQAKKDFELTWEDVQLLDFYAMECQVERSKGRKFNSSQEFFEEVLQRFNKAKNE